MNRLIWAPVAAFGLACGSGEGAKPGEGASGSAGVGGVMATGGGGGSSGSVSAAGAGGASGAGGAGTAGSSGAAATGAGGVVWSGAVLCGPESCPRETDNWQVCCWNRASGSGVCVPEADCQEAPDVAVLLCDVSMPPINGIIGPRCCFDTEEDGSARANYSDGCGSSHLTPTITVTLCDPLNPTPECDCQPTNLDGWLPPGYGNCAF